MSFYSEQELRGLGLAKFGENVRISNKASIYNPRRIFIGNNVRIDDFCVLSAGEGGIDIGNYVHLAISCSLIGHGKITLSDFSGISSKASIYSSNDDYSGEFLTGPTVPKKFTNVEHADVFIGKHVIIGSGSIVLPGVTLEKGVAIGALSLISKSCAAFGIYVGINRRIGERKKNILELEKNLLDEKSPNE
jgi:acetyltransferase-like isoleucine patch superfamily enzyme